MFDCEIMLESVPGYNEYQAMKVQVFCSTGAFDMINSMCGTC